jgi:beta-glucosidase/6-phospho-beta-glucosidase/beta-galactosidase
MLRCCPSDIVFEELGPLVQHWLTFNEPWSICQLVSCASCPTRPEQDASGRLLYQQAELACGRG